MGKENKQKRKTKKVEFSKFKEMPRINKDEWSVFDLENDLTKPENQLPQDDKVIQQMIIKQRHCGTIDFFDRYLKGYVGTESNFTTVSYGITRKIIFGKKRLIFSGIKGDKKPVGMHLIGYVKRDIDALLKENNYSTPKIPKDTPYLTYIHHQHLEYYGTGIEALAIDINHCYWRTAYLLKFITEETYLRGLVKPEYKDGRLIAIGTLGKILTVRKYKAGIKVEEYMDDREYLIYGGFFWAVIVKVHRLMVELLQTLKEDFLMFLTDCIFIDPRKKELVQQIMEKHGYTTKCYSVVFTAIDADKVAWINDKGDVKQMAHRQKLNKNDSKDSYFK